MKKIIVACCALSLLGFSQVPAYGQGDAKAKLKAMKPQGYPTQQIEFVVAYAAGGGMDVTARILAKYVEKYIDNRVIVTNKTGGNGLIGHTYLALQAKNDGYIVGIVSTNFIGDSHLKSKGKWTTKDNEPLNYINEDPVTWVVTTDGPFKDKSLKDIIELAKQKPGTIRVAVSEGSSISWTAEQVESASGAKFIKVPFQGGAPAIMALLGGHVDVAGYYMPEYRGQLDAGKIRVIAQTGHERSPLLKNVPTYNESAGADDILWTAYRWASLPKGVARDRFNYLEEAIDAALHDPECIKDYEKAGIIMGLKYAKGKQLRDLIETLDQNYLKFFTKTGRMAK